MLPPTIDEVPDMSVMLPVAPPLQQEDEFKLPTKTEDPAPTYIFPALPPPLIVLVSMSRVITDDPLVRLTLPPPALLLVLIVPSEIADGAFITTAPPEVAIFKRVMPVPADTCTLPPFKVVMFPPLTDAPATTLTLAPVDDALLRSPTATYEPAARFIVPPTEQEEVADIEPDTTYPLVAASETLPALPPQQLELLLLKFPAEIVELAVRVMFRALPLQPFVLMPWTMMLFPDCKRTLPPGFPSVRLPNKDRLFEALT